MESRNRVGAQQCRDSHFQERGNVMTAEVVTLARANAKAPTLVNRNVPPKRVPNAAVRSREYLTSNEIEALMAAAKRSGRHGQRDATVILIAYRHGLRVSELVALRWDQIDLKQGTLHVNRLKNGSESVHPLRGPELRALRRAQRDYPSSPYVFLTERKGPLTASSVRKIVARFSSIWVTRTSRIRSDTRS